MPKIKEVIILNIPGKVKIGGHIYTISHVDNLIRDRDHMGESCGDQLSIKIDKSLPESVQQSVFIHEILEQFNFVYNVGLEHKQIYDLEAAIYTLIKDNPEIFSKSLDINVEIDNSNLVDKAVNEFARRLKGALELKKCKGR